MVNGMYNVISVVSSEASALRGVLRGGSGRKRDAGACARAAESIATNRPVT